MQHHDGITGTESPKVADMYLRHLRQAMMEGEELLAALLLLPRGAGASHGLYGKTGLSNLYQGKRVRASLLTLLQCPLLTF